VRRVIRTAARKSFVRAAIVIWVALLVPSSSKAEPVAVAHLEGLAHGFVELRTLEGAAVADGDLIQNAVQTASGNRVTARLLFRFKDGSTRDEVTVYTQRKTFHLLSNHVVQKGPSFKMPMESTIDAKTGRVTIRYTEDGKEKMIDDRMELPDDLANGMTFALLKNISPRTPKTTVSMLAMTPQPRLVKLEFTPAGEDSFLTGGSARKATHYVMKVSIPGLTGAIASVLGKTPPDSHFWVLGGAAPAFVKAETELSAGGPTWRIELVSPDFSSASRAAARKPTQDSQRAGRRQRPAAAARVSKKKPLPSGDR
jgi:hypothetical protein